MTTKQFWQNASNWGLITGAALVVMNLVGWALKLETGRGALYELLLFIVICPAIVYTGRRNAAMAGPEGYTYGRAVGYVFAMTMFAGIVYGVGRFLIMNFIARDYYEALNSQMLDDAFTVYANTPLYEQMLSMRSTMTGMLRNPFYLIFSGVLGMVARGGFLGLILCAFFKKDPLPFTPADHKSADDEPTDHRPADEQ